MALAPCRARSSGGTLVGKAETKRQRNWQTLQPCRMTWCLPQYHPLNRSDVLDYEREAAQIKNVEHGLLDCNDQ